MSPLKKKKLLILRKKLDNLDNNLIKILKKRTNLVNKVLSLKERKNQTYLFTTTPQKKTLFFP